MVRKIAKCIHCLETKEKTDDHILPKSYYFPSVPNEIRNQWVAPACFACNNDLGKSEDELLTILGLCLNRFSDGNAIGQKVLASLNPRATNEEREKRIRTGKAKKILDHLIPMGIDNKGIFPNFGYHDGTDPGKQKGILIPHYLPLKIGEKIIKGIEYKLDSRYVDSTFDLSVYFCQEDSIQDVISLIRNNGLRYIIAPGFEFFRVAFDDQYFLYEIRIWEKFIIYGALMKKGQDQ